MTHLVKIGNSHGVRIPKPLIEQAQLESKDLQLQIAEGGLLITSQKSTHAGLLVFQRQIRFHSSRSNPSSRQNMFSP